MRFFASFPVLFVAARIACVAAAEPEIPKTRPGEVLQVWLAAFNSGDRAKLEAYLAKYEPERQSHIDQLADFRNQTGGFTLIRVEKSEPLSLEALVKEREGSNYGHLTVNWAMVIRPS